MSTVLQKAHVGEIKRTSLPGWLLTMAVCALLLSVGGLYEIMHLRSLTSISNGDFWWHLRTGLWMLQNHAVPRNGLYSQAGASAWMASSWLFEVLVAAGYSMLGLRFLPFLAIAGKIALATVTFLLAGGLRGRFWTAVVLSAAAQYILDSMQPLPGLLSVLVFALELLLLMEGRAKGSVTRFYWLPVLFLFWANLSVQFVYGIMTLLLFVASCAMERWAVHAGIVWLERPNCPSLKRLGAMTLLSLLATTITPYGWKLYALFFAGVTSAANPHFPDFQALRFRSPSGLSAPAVDHGGLSSARDAPLARPVPDRAPGALHVCCVPRAA